MTPIYLDNQATTPMDPRVIEAVSESMRLHVGNPASAHRFGQEMEELITFCRATIAKTIGARPNEIVFTSGATESNNLAIKGLACHPRRRGKHIVSVSTEHLSVLDPLRRLMRDTFDIVLVQPRTLRDARGGWVDPQSIADVLRPDTLLVSVMLANNEIGVIQSLPQIAEICHRAGALLHTDATQAIGKLPVDVRHLGVDLMSFSAHKVYGPKGIGALYVCRERRPIKLSAQMDGGGHEGGLRSGTLPVPLIVGFAKALELADVEWLDESLRIRALRDRLYQRLAAQIPECKLNGPELSDVDARLAGNLNLCLPGVAAQTLMLEVPDVAFSTGSACSSAQPEPSHVLLALGITEDEVRSSMRLSLGRFTTEDEVDRTTELLVTGYRALKA